MPASRRWLLLVAAFCSLPILAACGGSGSMHVTPQAPVFSSTPPTAAAQDTPYSYSISATDPAGGTVSFSLTTAPTGAALSGSSLAWTPAASQSRLSNSFTVTATTSEGGTAAQSWSVSPTGTVTVNEVATYWSAAGQQQVPISATANINISAMVPQSDGSVTVLPGSVTAPGVISIPGVPAGYYWLAFTPTVNVPPAVGFWTSTSTFDAGRDISGVPVQILNSSQQTTFDFNLSGLDSVASTTPLSFQAGMPLLLPFFTDPADSTTLSKSINVGSNIDWSQLKTGFLLQFEPSTLGPWNNLVLGPAAELTDLSFTNGSTNTITQALQSSPQASLDVNVLGTQWASLFVNASPSTPASYASGMSLVAEPFVTGIDAPVALGGLTLTGTTLETTGLGFTLQPFGGCDPTGFALVGTDNQPAILTDQNLGNLQYGDPFPQAWTRAFSFCQEAVVPITLPGSGSTADFALVAGERVAPSNAALAPLVAPVQSPTIGGGSLFTAATLNTTTPTLSWSAPSGPTPTGYRVQVFVASSLPSGGTVYLTAGSFSTAKTSLTLLPLTGGNTYVFAITSLVDAAANYETKPYRSALPTAFANVVSAPITITAGTAQARIHGDARRIRAFSQPGVETTSSGLPRSF